MTDRSRQICFLVASGLVGSIFGLIVGSWLTGSASELTNRPPNHIKSSDIVDLASSKTPPVVDQPTAPTINKDALGKVLADFEKPTGSRLSLVIHDLTNQERLVSFNDADLYTVSSLYKLYLAYLAYEDIDKGLLTLNQPFVHNHPYYQDLNLGACLHLTVALSDSVCGERLLNHYGYPAIQARLEGLGLSTIEVAAFKASAEDMTRLLELIYGQNLFEDSRRRLLTSMRSQAYDTVLQPSFESHGAAYTKTGLYASHPHAISNWIAIGIIELEGQHQAWAVSILHENIPEGDVSALAQSLAEAMFLNSQPTD